jgi:hypothetical protein
MGLNRSNAYKVGFWAFIVCSSCIVFAAPPDPCSLLTKAQVSAVLGVQTAEGDRVAPTLCEWTVPGQATTNAKRVTLTLQNPQAFDYAKMPVGHGITKIPASGIGDDAVFGTTPRLATTLTVKKGNLVFVVHVWGFPIDQPGQIEQVQAMEKTLALDVLSKL